MEIYIFRPKLGRSCRFKFMLGHGYESVVEIVLFIVLNTCLFVIFIQNHYLLTLLLLSCRTLIISPSQLPRLDIPMRRLNADHSTSRSSDSLCQAGCSLQCFKYSFQMTPTFPQITPRLLLDYSKIAQRLLRYYP